MKPEEAFEVVRYGLLEGGAPPTVEGVKAEFESGFQYFDVNGEPELAGLFKRLAQDEEAFSVAVRYLQSLTRDRNYIHVTPASAGIERELAARIQALI